MNNKKLIFSVAVLIAGALIFAGLVRISRLNNDLSSMKLLADSAQKETQRLKEEKDKVSKEKEKLQADSVSYMANNSLLQDEKDRLSKDRDELKAELGNKDVELQAARARIEKIERAYGRKAQEQAVGQNETKNGFEGKVWELEAALQKEKGTCYFNMGVVYAEQGKYDEAIDAYRHSLGFNPRDADALFNLAVLYEGYENDPGMALECYKKVLQLDPSAEDKENIEANITRLKLAVNE